jgi:ribosome-binding protein aMBF1 (putative translation factor)
MSTHEQHPGQRYTWLTQHRDSRPPERRRQEPPDYLADLLRAGRSRCGWTQRDVAERVGIAVSYLSKLENGHGCPSVVVARALAAVLFLTDDEKRLVLAAGLDGVGRDWRPAR